MPVIFTKDLSQATLLSAFNNQIAKFQTNTIGETPLQCTISTSGSNAITIVITPDPTGRFEYNFSQIFKQIVNSNYYQDRILDAQFGADPTTPNLRYTDSFVYKRITILFTMTMISGNVEAVSRSYNVLRSVVQLENYKKGLIHSLNQEVAILLPFFGSDIRTHYATFWHGYAFDIPIYSNSTRTITITHQGNLNTWEVVVPRGLSRLFLSVGDSDIGTQGLLPTTYGLNELRFTWSGFTDPQQRDLITLWLEKKPQACGRYLKWFTEAGGWAYYLFQFQEGEREGKLQGEVGLNFEDLGSTHEPESVTGIDYREVDTLFAPQLKREEKMLIDTLANSPKIYEYLEETFQRQTSTSWVSANLKSNSLKTLRRGTEVYDATIKLQKAERNTFKM